MVSPPDDSDDADGASSDDGDSSGQKKPKRRAGTGTRKRTGTATRKPAAARKRSSTASSRTPRQSDRSAPNQAESAAAGAGEASANATPDEAKGAGDKAKPSRRKPARRSTTAKSTTAKRRSSRAATPASGSDSTASEDAAAAAEGSAEGIEATAAKRSRSTTSRTGAGTKPARRKRAKAGTGTTTARKTSTRKATAPRRRASASAKSTAEQASEDDGSSSQTGLSIPAAVRAGLWAPAEGDAADLFDVPADDHDESEAGGEDGRAAALATSLRESSAAGAARMRDGVGHLRTQVQAQRQRIGERLGWLDRPAAWLTAAFDGLARVRLVAVLCVALIATAAFVPGVATIPPIDRDESRYAQASRQMVATGDFVDIRFQDRARYDKPIGIYWLQSAALIISGADVEGDAPPVWIYRTVSLVAAGLAALLVYWLALSFGPPPLAFAAAILFSCTILVAAEARLAKTDAVLLALTVIAQAILARAFISKRDSAVRFYHAAIFWTAMAAGLLVKGPVMPAIVLATGAFASLADRRLLWVRRLRPGYGILWMALLAVPWFVAISLTSGGSFFDVAVGRELAAAFEGEPGDPSLFPGLITFVSLPTLGWPIGPLALLAVPFALRTWKDRGTKFLIAWIVPALVMLELTALKLPHYALPLYPALAVLAARMVAFEKLPAGFWAGLVKLVIFAVPVALAIAMPLLLTEWGDGIAPSGAAFGAAVILLALIAWGFLLHRHARAASLCIVACALCLFAGSFAGHLPSARTLWITPQLAGALDAVVCADPELATLGYREPSLVLMTRTDLILETEPEGVAAFLAGEGCRAAFVTQPEADAVRRALAEEGAAVRAVARVEGIVLNGWDAVTIDVLTNDAAAAQLR
ncbi:MAG: phospholipid carrier-dependent glycosyltransferase [Pseudomonadota bacterium]